MSEITPEEFENLFEEVEEFVKYKFYKNLFDEMSYHGYSFKNQDVDDVIHLTFSKNSSTSTSGATGTTGSSKKKAAGAGTINVVVLSHLKQNKHYLLARKGDFDANIKQYIAEDAENLFIYDNEDIKKSLIKHTKLLSEDGVEFIFRGKQSYVCNIFETIEEDGYSIVARKEIQHLESMRVLPSFTEVAPLIDIDDPICRMLRAKRGDIIKRDDFDPSIKSFTVKYFLVR